MDSGTKFDLNCVFQKDPVFRCQISPLICAELKQPCLEHALCDDTTWSFYCLCLLSYLVHRMQILWDQSERESDFRSFPLCTPVFG